MRIGSGGHFYRKSTGGDSFSSMRWEAVPGEEAELNDYLESLGIMDDARPYADEVDAMNLYDDGYELSIEDEDNPLLEESSEEEDEEQDVAAVGDGELPEDFTPAEATVLAGADLTEAASRGETNVNPPDCCDVCGSELASRSVLIDGRLRGSLMFATMCADCFLRQGEGIGWGSGQAYLRQPDGTWLMVAGFRPKD